MGTTEPLDLTPDPTRLVNTVVVGGGAGTIGRRLVPALTANGHRVIVAGRASGEIHVDLTSHRSIENMYQRIDGVDGVVSIAAHGALDDFAALTVEALHDNMRAKFYGQWISSSPVSTTATSAHHSRSRQGSSPTSPGRGSPAAA